MTHPWRIRYLRRDPLTGNADEYIDDVVAPTAQDALTLFEVNRGQWLAKSDPFYTGPIHIQHHDSIRDARRGKG